MTDHTPAKTCPLSPEIEEHQATKRDKASQYNPIPPLLRPYPPKQTINPRNLTRSAHNPPINTRQRLPLRPKVFVHRIRLAQHPIGHAVTIIDAPALVEHVFRLGGFRVRGAVSVDVGADVGEQVGSVAGVGDGGAEAGELAPVVEEDFAVPGEVVLFERGGGEGGFGVEEAGELGYERFSLLESSVSFVSED